MRLELRWAAGAALALTIGLVAAGAYARIAAPAYRWAAAVIGNSMEWRIRRVAVEHDGERPGEYLRLHGELLPAGLSGRGAAIVTRVEAGAAIEAPLIFWTLLVLWPARLRSRVVLLLLGIPMFLALECATTVCQLLNGFAEAAAMLAGAQSPLTGWERWSRFIESGGRDVLAVCAALLTIGAASRVAPTAAAPRRP